MNLAAFFQDAFSSNLYAVDTGLTGDTDTNLINNPATDAWGYLTETGVGQIPARGVGISPDGTKIAMAAVNGFTKQYKVLVYDVGSTPVVASTLDAPNQIFLVTATKLKEYTKAADSGSLTMATWVNGGADSLVTYNVLYGVVDIQVDNDGNVWWLEARLPTANTEDTLNPDEPDVTDANDTIGANGVSVQQLLIGDTQPTDLGFFLVQGFASPSNGTTCTAENPLRGAYCPGGFFANIVLGLWDGPRARIVARSRTNATGVTSYDARTGDCPVIVPDSDHPIDQIYYTAGTAGSIIADFEGTAQVAIVEPTELIQQTATGTHYISGLPVSYTYFDQIPIVVYRDSAFTDVSSIVAPFVAETLPRAVRRTTAYITFPYTLINDAADDPEHLIVQTTDGSVAKWSATDAAAPASCGFSKLYGSSVFGVLLGISRQFVNTACWRIRATTIGSNSIAVTAVDETISPSNPDTIQDPDQDVSMRNGVAWNHVTINDTDYDIKFANSTVNG